MTIELTGFKTEIRQGIRFDLGQEVSLEFTMAVASVAESITVSGAAPLVETTKTTVGNTIKREALDTLPVSGRNAANLAMLAPGVVPRGSTEEPVTSEGQLRGSTEAILDGVSNKLVLVNSIRSNAPPDSVEEFQVLTSQYAAEFGNGSGIVLNTITRSGTNILHGRGYYFHRDQKLDARNAFSVSKASFQQKQGGGWLGGPIIKDRTHFFGSVEITRRVTVATVNNPLQRLDVEQPFSNNNVLVKVTHQFNPNNRLSARFSADHPLQKKQGVGGANTTDYGIDYLTKSYDYVGNLFTILSPRALNEFRVQYSSAGIDIQVDKPEAFTILRPSSNSGKPSNQPQAIPEVRMQFVDNFSYERGSHRLKFGFDYSRVVSDGYLYQNNPGVFTFSTDRAFAPNDPTTYPITFIKNDGGVTFKFFNTNFSAFAQDAWRVSSAFTLNIGMRYDAYDVTGTELRKDNFAPRIGFAWDPFRTGKTSIRGGFGAFYNSIMFNVPIFTSFFAKQRTIQIANPGYPDPFSHGVAGNVPISTYFPQSNQPIPRTYNTTIGIQREIAPGFSVSADYVNSKGRNLIRIIDKNPVTPPTFARPDPTKGFVRTLESTGYSDYQALLVGASWRVGQRGQVGAAYTLSNGKTTNEAENGTYQQDDLNPNDAYGFNNGDQRHRAVINGSFRLPFGIQFGTILMARTGTPVNITTGTDNNKNLVTNDRPDLAVSATVGTDDMKNKASFIDPGTRAGNLPRNAGRGPTWWQLDVRLSKVFEVGKSRIELMLEAYNVDNHVNLNNWVGNLRSASFGQSITADIARQVQLGLRVGF